MSHQHYCMFKSHLWDCSGTALHDGEKEPSVCLCGRCHLPLEEGDHSKCDWVGDCVTCPQHMEEYRRWRKANRPSMIAFFKKRKEELERIIKRMESEE
jgi:hypothetical protein